ncbi:hypothetical protein [[Micrococcus luteus] ATCC 49442]|uniref:hypothetical protein n=1 Tax=[Micrococcus luteus] ATCC 49442 TaxID=2698727 RepID=UPI0013DB99A8|nr:hypothetical protein [[Micrococcus luteus] ATCC 49442]
MFAIEEHDGYSAYNERRHVIDHDSQARLQLINGSAQTGQDLFLLTWQGRSIPIVTFSQNTADRESGLNQVHVHIRAVGESRFASNSELAASVLSPEDQVLAHRLAAEALLVYGGWYDGLSYPDRFFVVRDPAGGEDVSYTLASFGYSGASRLPNYHSQLEATEKSIRLQAVEDSWGLELPDAVFVIVLHNRRRATLSMHRHMRLSVPELFPWVRPAELEDLETRADRLGFNSSTYGQAHVNGESVESVLSRMSVDAPGFSGDTYRRALAHGTLMILRNRDNEERRRKELIESARSANLLDGVFALLYFNWRFSKAQFLGAIPIHETLGDLHSRADLDDAIARAGKLIQAGGRYAWTPVESEEQVRRLMTDHPGFSVRCVHDALSWGYQQNR